MRATIVMAVVCLAARVGLAGTVSYTGSLASPDDSSTAITVNMASAGNLVLQTWSFGGGTNAAGATIGSGGFDPFVGVFAGVGNSAVLIDGSSDALSNYGSYVGCPPAAMVNIGGATCGDLSMTFSLAAGTYTVLLTDGLYLPIAVFETNGTLGDGFSDLTGGVFQTCNGGTCVFDSAQWALDITTPGSNPSAPEPAALSLCGIGLAALAVLRRRPRTRVSKLKL